MLAPRASSALACLRCDLELKLQLQLGLGRPTPCTPRRRPSHPSFSTTARRHDAADDVETRNAATKPVRIVKEYTRQGKLIRQRRAKLGMKRMDEDADILVINEAPEPEDPEKKQPEPFEPISVPDILSSLQQEGAPVTNEDVARQLDSLRPMRGSPHEPHHVTTADFVKLVAALTRGFTTAQLSHYCSAAKSIKQDALFKVVKASVKATKRSEWHPTTTSIEKRLPGVETIKKPKQKAKGIRKATLVDKILRDVWKLELLEEMEAPGELELRLKEWELNLLHAGANDSNLARIAKIRNAKVEIHWPTNVLRITADKNTAEYTANDVEEALSKTHTTSLDLKRWAAQLNMPSSLPNNDLAASLPAEYVASITGAHIYPSDPFTLKIHGLNETSVAEAKRTLIRLLPFKESATRTIDTQRLDAAKHDSYLLPTFNETKSLDYAHRSLSLGRWALPVTRSADTFSPEEHGTSQEEIKLKSRLDQSTHGLINRVVSFMRPPVDGSFTGSESAPQNRRTGYWALEPEYKVSADFGQALFPLEYADPNKVVEAAADSARSPFQPAIPGLGSLLASSEFQNLSRTETPALLYEFIPSPDQKVFETETSLKQIGPTFPKLHVQVRTGRDGNRPTIHKLSLGFQERVHDVLLPDQAADIRFYRYGRLRFSSKSHHDKNVEEWSEAVRQNIESGGRLSAPSLTIDIPKWTIPGYPSDATGMLPIKYLFSGIQFRQSVTGRLLDTQISYSTMQSGKLGARGGALSAYSPNLKDDQYEAQIREFATKCVQMVDYITQAGAQTQPLRQMRLPRNDHSARKQRRAALLEGEDPLLTHKQEQTRGQYRDQRSNTAKTIEDLQDQDQVDTYDQTQTSLNDQDDARLASRLDEDAPPSEANSAADEAQSEAEEDKLNAREILQSQEADALLNDLFGDDAVEERTNETDESDVLLKDR
ncbi:uncharacterized protein EKO05_0003344 [Ascochyta rabiei]|uniref:Uncharacterized protein n=1 Tax=Didymella rabiei TaxID=5454 RepID=A0A162YEQ1_DIDRA|nr:uncharacterized protein EKO05_0003344 [Ascochyta rabiei]KZM19997.1 hypothetical protein ST47_g8873 [Ascochyta rabiei]UPX12807.1 hypothetical protein EKO05_0003344 [Ascochyta rabiei]